MGVRVGWTPVVGSLPLVVASEEGLFAAAGVAVDSVRFNNSNDAVTALIANQIDLIPAVALIPIMHLELQRPGQVRVFAHSRATPDRASDSLIVSVDSPIESLSGLAGRRIGVFPGTAATKMLRAFLRRHAVATDAISFVPLEPATQLSALSAGAIDALFSYEPTTTIAKESAEVRVLHGSVFAALLNPSPLGGAVISRAFERAQPKAAVQAIAALDEAVWRMREDPVGTRTLIPNFVAVTPELAQALTVVESGLSTENDVHNLQELADLLYDVGEIPERFDVTRLIAPTTE